jgi:RimJ/RimL family protein N-acetyltransferase
LGESLELKTPRLLLRPLQASDAKPIVAYRSLAEVARFQSWESFGPADAASLIAAQASVVPNTPGTWLQLAIVRSDSGAVIGDCGIHFQRDDARLIELGITLSPSHQQCGFAGEALRSVLEYVFGRLGKHRVTALIDADNHAAASLFRRLGFRLEAHHIENVWFKGVWGSECVFALLRREWELLYK